MAKIHSIKIKNFRGINEFSQVFGNSDFICLIGRGDSGKSTILEAISLVLSPSWTVQINDSDFHNCNLSSPIEIQVSLVNIPIEFLNEEKYGLHIRGLNTANGEIVEIIEDSHEKVITIQLTIGKDLEPDWSVVNGRQPPKRITASDRAKLNVFMVSDYVDRHFSWSKGNPLYALLAQEESDDENENIIIDALRDAKSTIDRHPFREFDLVTSKVVASAALLGVDISSTKTSVDFKDLFMKDGKVSLHGENIPFRLKGKGSKRLISIAIQMALANTGGIVLIDEIEQGLEPDRTQHLINTLKSTNAGQIFITTHSRDVLVELETKNLFLMRKNALKLVEFENSLQGCLRKNPESFFAQKLIVCEGATEIGICRSLNSYKISKGHANIAYRGVRFADGTGSEMISYFEGFTKAGFETCLFCDSDDKAINLKKVDLLRHGSKIIDWENLEHFEAGVIKDLPFQVVSNILDMVVAITNQTRSDVWTAVRMKFGPGAPHDFTSESDSAELRSAISLAANKGSWFKSQSNGSALGDLLFESFTDLQEGSRLKSNLNELSIWIDRNGL